MLLRDIRDLINLGHFDPIIRAIPLTVIPLSGAHCTFYLVINQNGNNSNESDDYSSIELYHKQVDFLDRSIQICKIRHE
jgi:hypothetical protein